MKHSKQEVSLSIDGGTLHCLDYVSTRNSKQAAPSCSTCKRRNGCKTLESLRSFGKINEQKSPMLFSATFLTDNLVEYSTEPFEANSWDDAAYICTHNSRGEPYKNEKLISLSIAVEKNGNRKKKKTETWYPVECDGVYRPYLYSSSSGKSISRPSMTKGECITLCRELNEMRTGK